MMHAKKEESWMDDKTCVLPVSVILGLLLPACLRGQEPSAGRAVAPELIQGGELVVKSSNFAVATPAGQWQWSVIENRATVLKAMRAFRPDCRRNNSAKSQGTG